MRYPQVQLFDRPDPSGVVLFDFNSDVFTTRAAADGFTLGAPQMLGNEGSIAPEWGPRAARFRAWVDDGEQQAHRLLSDLAQSLLRDEVYLLFQFSASSPTSWAKVKRTVPEPLSFANVFCDRATNRWVFAVSFLCEPWLLGEQVTLGPYTLSNNPAESGGLSVALPDIKGDAPAPLQILRDGDFHPFGMSALSDIAPLSKQAEACTLSFDTSAVAVANFSGGQGARVDFATYTDFRGRLSWSVDADVTDDAVRAHLSESSQVRVLAFVSRSDETSTFRVGVSSSVGSLDPDPATHATVAAGFRSVLDLGVVPLARSFPGLDGVADDLATLTVMASRESGTGTLDFDGFLLVPSDQTLFFGAATTTVPGVSTYVDGEAAVVAPVSGSPGALRVSSSAPVSVPRGDFVKVRPGETNVLAWMVGLGVLSNGARVDVDTTSDLTLTYRPRWLWMAAH